MQIVVVGHSCFDVGVFFDCVASASLLLLLLFLPAMMVVAVWIVSRDAGWGCCCCHRRCSSIQQHFPFDPNATTPGAVVAEKMTLAAHVAFVVGNLDGVDRDRNCAAVMTRHVRAEMIATATVSLLYRYRPPRHWATQQRNGECYRLNFVYS